jgi:hypothetical protein
MCIIVSNSEKSIGREMRRELGHVKLIFRKFSLSPYVGLSLGCQVAGDATAGVEQQ